MDNGLSFDFTTRKIKLSAELSDDVISIGCKRHGCKLAIEEVSPGSMYYRRVIKIKGK